MKQSGLKMICRKKTAAGWLLNGCPTIPNENLSSIAILHLLGDLKAGTLIKENAHKFGINHYQFIKEEDNCFYFFNLNGDEPKVEILENDRRVQITTSKTEGLDLRLLPLKEPHFEI